MRNIPALLGLVALLSVAVPAEAQDAFALGAPVDARERPALSLGAFEPEDTAVGASNGYRPTWQMLIPGLSLTIASYGGSAFVALTAPYVAHSTGGSRDWFFVPIIGPFVLAGSSPGMESQLNMIWLGTSQLVGIALTIAGLAIEHRESGVVVAPNVAPDVAGLSVSGTF